jgi:lipid II:glycine glycyltransferase (peptidoglycan interpeptide bridge formation enzyme)
MTSILTAEEWDTFLEQHPQTHILQTAPWGELKSAFGWQPVRVTCGESGAQILIRKLPLSYSIAYIPKGPVGDHWDRLWPEVDAICRQYRSVFLKVEPDLWDDPMPGDPVDPGLPTSPKALLSGFRASRQSIQPRRTLIVDLVGTENDVLDRMKQKTRYNIRLAQKKGVVTHPTADLDTFHKLMKVTGERDRFGVHSIDYYRKVYDLFHPRGECELLVAEYEGEPLAGLIVFARGMRSWYFYGASSMDHRDRMPTYLLQWEAMRWARSRGCTLYDLWGVPDEGEDVLEAGFTSKSSGLWGVYRFKRGFGGSLMRTASAWDRIYHSFVYRLYQLWASRRIQE